MLATFAEKIMTGFNAVLSFLGKMATALVDIIFDGFWLLIDLLQKPMVYLLWFLEGIIYFFEKLMHLVIVIIKIFMASFQFIGAIIKGITRTITQWTNVSVTGNTNFPSASHQGFAAVIDILQPTGLLTVVPMVALAFLWFFFVVKIVGLFGGEISVSPFRGGN